MDLDFWHQKWEKGETGFHQENLNPYLAFFYGKNGPPAEKRDAYKVFVPLCGKSLDMLWLSENGYTVLGIECSPVAIKDFVKNHGITIDESSSHHHAKYIINAERDDRKAIELIQGDFFNMSPEDMKGVTDIFDRASLIALPGPMRKQYADKMAELTSPGTRMLLITLTYPQHEMDGPPFSVSDKEIEELYSKNFSIDKLLVKNIFENETRFQERGLTSLVETAFKLTRV